MAKLKQCPNGHYYDPGIHASCPYCSNVSASVGDDVRTDYPGAVADYDFPTAPPVKENPGVDNHAPEDYAGHTVPVMPQRHSAESGGKEDEPQWLVVGWLVAVEGPYRGKSFEIHHGNTYIGREEGDIILKKDRAVSASRQANTVYEDRKNRFLLVAGQSTNLVYVDDELLPNSSNVELKPYSSIELGKSKFLFVPFCSDKFRWSDENV